MKLLTTAYQQHSDDKLIVSYGSSGKLYAQIVRGAPFEIFLSADAQKPLELEKLGLIVPNSRFTYGIGKLVLWSIDNNLLLTYPHPPDLKGLPFNKFAIANPRTAPYGLAAQQTLESLGFYQDVKNKLVKGENIAQTLTFIKTGNAQLGLIAVAQYLQLSDYDKGSAWLVPQELHQPVIQDAVLLKKARADGENRGGASAAATHFYQFLQSSDAQKIIADSGYLASTSTINQNTKSQHGHE